MRRIFFDTNLSEPAGQSCASCHTPSAGFADLVAFMMTLTDGYSPFGEMMDALFGAR